MGMKDWLSEPDEVDNLIDGLRVSEYQEHEEVGDGEPTRWSMPPWVVFTGILFFFIMGAVFGLSAVEEPRRAEQPAPVITKTKTETATKAAIPPSCQRAMDMMRRMMEANSTIAGAGEEQLDISHAARQAIFLKDWKALDKVMVRQTDLNNRLDNPNAKAIQVYADLDDAMKECIDAIS